MTLRCINPFLDRKVDFAGEERIQISPYNLLHLFYEGTRHIREGFNRSHSQNASNLARRIHHIYAGVLLLVPLINLVAYQILRRSVPAARMQLEEQLDFWCQQAGNSDEAPNRNIAANKILSCFLTRSPDLDLNGLQLTSLPKGICALTHLEKLNLEGNQLSALPQEMQHLQRLCQINLSNNRFEILPEVVCTFSGLLSLNISQNELTALPHGIENLHRLIVLDASRNRLFALPHTIDNLLQLRSLRISHNQLRELPQNIDALNQLLQLDISFNELNRLPEEICYLRELRHLVALNNSLTAIPEQLATLPNFTRLHLEGNQLSVDAIDAFQAAVRTARENNPNEGPTLFLEAPDRQINQDSIRALLESARAARSADGPAPAA